MRWWMGRRSSSWSWWRMDFSKRTEMWGGKSMVFFAYSGNGLASTPSTLIRWHLDGEVLKLNLFSTKCLTWTLILRVSDAFFYCDLLCVLLFLLLINTNIIICYVNLGRDAWKDTTQTQNWTKNTLYPWYDFSICSSSLLTSWWKTFCL